MADEDEDDLYGDQGSTAVAEAPERPGDKSPKGDDGEEKHDEGKTGLLNQEICPGLDVGDEIVLKVTGVHDQEYEVQYVEEPDEEKEPERPPKPPPGRGRPPGPPGGGGMSGMFD